MKALFTTIAVVAALGAAGGLFSGSLRSRVTQQIDGLTQWTAADREADPVGFADYARECLKQDLTVMQQTRRELSAEVGSLADELRAQQARHDQAVRMADEFRVAYQEASADDSFPIELRGAAYTQAQVKSQVSLLLAETDGFAASLTDLQDVQQQAEAQVKELAVRISSTESQLAMLSTEREMLKARLLTVEGDELMAQMDELMTGNQRLIDGNPVRTVAELSEVPSAEPRLEASRTEVEEFLAGPSKIRPATSRPMEPQPATEAEEHVTAKHAERKSKARRPRNSKPIFQQF